jgi:hypothetical protein
MTFRIPPGYRISPNMQKAIDRLGRTFEGYRDRIGKIGARGGLGEDVDATNWIRQFKDTAGNVVSQELPLQKIFKEKKPPQWSEFGKIFWNNYQWDEKKIVDRGSARSFYDGAEDRVQKAIDEAITQGGLGTFVGP